MSVLGLMMSSIPAVFGARFHQRPLQSFLLQNFWGKDLEDKVYLPEKNKASPLVEKPNQSTRGPAFDLPECTHIDYRCQQSGMGGPFRRVIGAGYLDSTRETTLIQLQGTQTCSQRNLSIPKSAQRPTYTCQIGQYNLGSVPKQTRRDQKSHLDEYSTGNTLLGRGKSGIFRQSISKECRTT